MTPAERIAALKVPRGYAAELFAGSMLGQAATVALGIDPAFAERYADAIEQAHAYCVKSGASVDLLEKQISDIFATAGRAETTKDNP